MPLDPRLLEELERRRQKNQSTGTADKVHARHQKGVLTARERIAGLVAEGTFLETGAHAQHTCRDFGMEKKEIPCDGVVTGTGLVDGRAVAIFSQDFLVAGGTLGRVHSRCLESFPRSHSSWGAARGGRPTARPSAISSS